MPPEDSARARLALAFVIHSDSFEKVHYALAAASAAAAVGRPVILFFAMGAVRALARGAGWHRLRTAEGKPAERVDAGYRDSGVADFETLLAACRDLGVRLMVCEMGLRVEGLDGGDLRSELDFEEGGLATLMMEIGEGNIVFI